MERLDPAYITLAAVLLGMILQYMREGRARDWATEDSKKRDAKVEATAEALAVKSEAQHIETKALIDENTKVSIVAFEEANDIKNRLTNIEAEKLKLEKELLLKGGRRLADKLLADEIK